MKEINKNYLLLKTEIDKKSKGQCTLIAVSKTRSVEEIKEIYDLGHRDFGENKVQELELKYKALPKDIRWHMVGHLQSNKVKYIAPFVHMIHSADSLKLLKEVEKRGAKNNRKINLLMQVNISKEESKSGFEESEILDFFEQFHPEQFPQISFKGLLGIASFSEDKTLISQEFKTLYSLFTKIRQKKPEVPNFTEISMGMTSDYLIAIHHHSTMVRIGTKIFGERNYG